MAVVGLIWGEDGIEIVFNIAGIIGMFYVLSLIRG
jgi:hypothetical protein